MTTPGGGDAVFRLRWEQSGAEVPKQARAELLGLAAAQGQLAQSGRSYVQGWATQGQILQAMQQDAKRASGAVTELGGAAQGAGPHLFGLRRAAETVALSAVGAEGPVGRLSGALLMFGAGGTVTIAAAAGLAIIAAGYRLVTQDAREAAEAHQKFLDKLHEQVAARVPGQDKLAQAQLELSNARDQLAELEQHAEQVRQGRLVGRGRTDEIALDEARAAITAAEAVVNQLRAAANTEHAAAGEASGKAWAANFLKGISQLDVASQMRTLLAARSTFVGHGRDAAAAWVDAFDKLFAAFWRDHPLQIPAPFVRIRSLADVAAGQAPFTTPAPRFLGTGAPSFGAFGTGPGAAVGATAARNAAQATAEQEHYNRALELTRGILVRAQTPQQIFNTGMMALQTSLDAGAISATQFDEGVKQLNEDLKKATKNTAVLAASIITAVSGAIAAVVSGGSAGGILSAIGGIVGLIPGGQIAGAVIGDLGSIALASESKGVTIDKYSAAALQQLKGIPTGPQRVELLIQSPTTGEIVDRVIYTLGERGRTDGVRRVPLGLYRGG